MKPKTFVNDFLGFVIYAEEISQDKTNLKMSFWRLGRVINHRNLHFLLRRVELLGPSKKVT